MRKKAAHWRDEREKASGFWQMRFMLGSYRLLGAKGLRLVVYPAVFFFYAFAPRVRSFSRSFLSRAAAFHGKSAPRPFDPFRHLVSFAFSMIEKIAAWCGDIDLESIVFHDDDVETLIAGLEQGKGAVIICSHVGNMEILRALATGNKTRVVRKFAVTSIVDFTGTAKFNRLIEEINPDSMMRLVSARDIGVDTVLDLQARLAAGELLVIAGDRTSATSVDKIESLPFLGSTAAFPQGAFTLASLMEAPVYFMFGLRVRDDKPLSAYDMHVYRSQTDFSGSRRERKQKIRSTIEEYIGHLERLSGEHPFQWYNFYDFWQTK
jgi:predicted LPLAT superfamily acyltransferase